MRKIRDIVMSVCAIVCLVVTGAVIGIYADEIAERIQMLGGAFWTTVVIIVGAAAIVILAKILGIEVSED